MKHRKLIIVALVVVALLILSRCGTSKDNKAAGGDRSDAPVEAPAETPAETPVDAPAEEPAEMPAQPEEPVETPADKTAESDEVSPELKAFCEGYLEFLRDYIDLTKKLSSGGMESITAALELAQKAVELTEYENELNAIDRDGLSTADAAYLLEFDKELIQLMAEIQE